MQRQGSEWPQPWKTAWAIIAMTAISACGDADDGEGTGGTVAATHAEVAEILGAGPGGKSSCSVASCHGSAAEAKLSLLEPDLRALMVGVPACEAPSLSLVEPFKPEESWLWIKLTGELANETAGDLAPQPAWGEPGTDCPGASGFGKRMPRVSPYSLEPAQLAKIRSWIEAGAPGPES
jgi:hypothetical protein